MELPFSAEQKIELKRQHRQIKENSRQIKNNCDARGRMMIYGYLNLRYEGSQCRLSEEQIARTKEFINNNIVTKSKQIISFIHESFGVKYTVSGIKAFLHKNGLLLVGDKSKSFESFQNAIRNFFQNINSFREELKTFIGLKMHVVRRT